MTHDHQLDDLLMEWSQQSSDADQLSRLQERIVNAAVADRQDRTVPASDTWKARADRRRVRDSSRLSAFFATGITACVLAILLLNVVRYDSTGGPGTPDYVQFSQQQLNEKSLLASEMCALFGTDVAWLAETGHDVEFGIVQTHETAAPATPPSLPLVIRVVVESRPHGTRQWTREWITDVVARDEETITVRPHRDAKQALQLWAYRLPDGMIAVDCSVPLTGTDAGSASSMNISEPGSPRQIISRVAAGTEYRVFQMVAVIAGELG